MTAGVASGSKSDGRLVVVPVLIVGFLLRGFLLVGEARSGLSKDAERFDRVARNLAAGGESLTQRLAGGGSETYIAIVAQTYRVFGPHPLGAQILNVALSFCTLLLVWGIIRRATGHRRIASLGSRALVLPALVWAIYPSVVTYSVLLLRESLISLLIASGVYCLVNSSRRSLYLSAAWLLAAAVLHGPLIVLLVAPLVKPLMQGQSLSRFTLVALPAAAMAFAAAPLWLSKITNSAGLDSLSEFDQDVLTSIVDNSGRGGSAYSVPFSGSPVLLPLTLVLRGVYFVLSPMPWSVRGATDLVAMISALVAVFALWNAWKRRGRVGKEVWVPLAIAIVVFSLGFGFGVSNAGTALRHRTKVWPLVTAVWVMTIPPRNRSAALEPQENSVVVRATDGLGSSQDA